MNNPLDARLLRVFLDELGGNAVNHNVTAAFQFSGKKYHRS